MVASLFQELFSSALDFLKLERIELGGSRGKILSDMVYSMNDEFLDSWRTLRESKYDPLDYNNKVLPYLHKYTLPTFYLTKIFCFWKYLAHQNTVKIVILWNIITLLNNRFVYII